MTDRLLPSSPTAIRAYLPSQSPTSSVLLLLHSSFISTLEGDKKIRRMSTPTPHHRPPSVPSTIFFLRHGARLDQHNPDWHLSSPTPYDPPLTQTGTAQAHQTGAAIKDALPHAPETSPSVSSSRRIVIHTSPFLRCVQTAVALASGLEEKVLLRVDAWLGEWLTPDYYTDIDPPPPARQLCQTAIAGLAGRTEGIGVDWGWDSLGLGGGGEYGEEWGSMHERFNGGLQRLLTYYEKESIRNNTADTTGDNAVETVVILVTHGAGCNALLGALSRKPVLIDIPISSLSQAILRPSTPSSSPSQIEYELVLQASTAHVAPSPHMRSTSFPSSTTTSTHSRAASFSSSRSPIIVPDKSVLEYHPVRSRSISSYPTFADIHQPAHNIPARHPSLHIRTSSALYPASTAKLSSGSQSRTGLWTPSNSVAVTGSDDEDADEGTEGRRKRAVGLWRSWASEQSGKIPDTPKEKKV
jgi:broad specificity phosphatase PhoE